MTSPSTPHRVSRLHLVVLVAWLASAFAAAGQSENDADWNHFGIDFRLGLNIKAKFSNVGASVGQPLPPLTGGADHNYSDGFVRLDSSGDRGDVTWNWGYQNSSQVSGAGTLLMHTARTDGAESESNDDPRLGLELTYARDIGRIGAGRWGLKAGLGFTDLKVRDTQPLSADSQLITDAYPLNGINPPRAPYAGSFSGPGPVISDTPTRTISTVAGDALITGSRQLDVWLYDVRFGPYLEMPLAERLSVQVSGGLAAGFVDSKFTFADTTSTSAGTVQATGENNGSGSMVGFYGEAGLAYQLVPGGTIFGGGQYQSLGEFNQRTAGRGAQLDLRQSVYFVVGVRLEF